MYTRAILSVATLMGLAALSSPAKAAVYIINCGSGGTSTAVQNQINAALKGDIVVVTGTCAAGTVTVSGKDTLSINSLSMQAPSNVIVTGSTHISFSGLTLANGTGSEILVTDHSSVNATNTVVNGTIMALSNSSVTFSTLTVTQAANSPSGGSAINCLQSSDCHFSGTTLTGVSSGVSTAPNIGIDAASASRFNFASGSISGFDWGVHVWNNATAFFNPDCATLSIAGNTAIGVYVRDGGIVKLEGSTPPLTSGCPADVVIANNGSYGLLAEGGGVGFLYRATVSGQAVDNVRVQNNSTVKVRSSTIAAATSTGRSAWVKSQSHLWFNEEIYGPSAGSTLPGPVCITNGSSVDTDNSSTVLTTTASCGQP